MAMHVACKESSRCKEEGRKEVYKEQRLEGLITVLCDRRHLVGYLGQGMARKDNDHAFQRPFLLG